MTIRTLEHAIRAAGSPVELLKDSQIGQTEANDLAALLRHYSVEVTSGDRKSIDAAKLLIARGTEIYIASPPTHPTDRMVSVAAELRRAGLEPVPHVVARNIKDRKELDLLLNRLSAEADVNRALVLAGDRKDPAGDLSSSLQILETGFLQKHGIRKIGLSWYPEGHARIPYETLATARAAKLERAATEHLDVTLVSQFCFESAPILATAKKLRAEGVKAPFRIGVAGPASRTALLKYAMICGVGASVRALKERPGIRTMIRETPEALLADVAMAQAGDPSLKIQGVHFFTFASLAASVQFVEKHTRVVERT